MAKEGDAKQERYLNIGGESAYSSFIGELVLEQGGELNCPT